MNSSSQSLRCIAIILAGSSALFSQGVLAQSAPAAASTQLVSSSPSTPQPVKPASHVETSVSLGSMAQLAATRISDTANNLTTESLAPSAGVFASLRQSFSSWLGYSVNLGYTHSTYRYTISPPASATGQTFRTLLPAHMYEISLSYIAQKHLTNRFTVFGEAGAGALAFAANNTGGPLPNRSNTFRPEGIAGFGIDYRLAHGLGVRAQYRALFIRYPYPDDTLGPRLGTVVNEPVLSLTYSFGKHAAH